MIRGKDPHESGAESQSDVIDGDDDDKDDKS